MAHDRLSLAITRFTRVTKKIPKPVKSVLRYLRVHKLFDLILNKYTDELNFQAEWAGEFKRNKEKVLEYWKRYRYFNEINGLCGFTENTRILDVGCGISTVLHFVKGKKYGIDPLANEYKRLYDFPRDIEIIQASGEKIPFASKYFEVVFCSNALDHVTSAEKAVSEIHRVLAEGGFFVLTVELFQERVERNAAHPYSLRREDLFDLLKNKFKVVFEKESP